MKTGFGTGKVVAPGGHVEPSELGRYGFELLATSRSFGLTAGCVNGTARFACLMLTAARVMIRFLIAP